MDFVNIMQYNVITPSILYKFFPDCRLIFQTLKFPSKSADGTIITLHLCSTHHGNVTTQSWFSFITAAQCFVKSRAINVSSSSSAVHLMTPVTLWYSVTLVHCLAPNTIWCLHTRFSTTMRHIQCVLIHIQAKTRCMQRKVASKRVCRHKIVCKRTAVDQNNSLHSRNVRTFIVRNLGAKFMKMY